MNLLFTLTTYPPSVGGAQLHQHQLARQFADRHWVQVLTHWDSARTDWLLGTTLRAPTPAIDYVIDGIAVRRFTLSLSERKRLVPWVLSYYAIQGLALERIAEAIAKEVEPYAQDASLVHNVRIGREGLSLASLKVARRRDIPFVLTPVHHPRWGGWFHRHYHKIYRSADGLIALTQAEKQTLVALGVAEERVFVTGHGPVLAERSNGAEFRLKYGLGQEPVILFLGQKYAYKGFDRLLRAAPIVWKRCPEARFVFMGPRTSYSKAIFKEVEDRRVLEMDNASLQEKTDALAACNILCLPSTQESFGGVFTEAWSFEKPVIGCTIPAVQEVVDHAKNGLLVDGMPAALAEAVLDLLGNSGLAQQLGRAGFEKLQSNYSWPQLAALTEDAYRKILSGIKSIN